MTVIVNFLLNNIPSLKEPNVCLNTFVGKFVS